MARCIPVQTGRSQAVFVANHAISPMAQAAKAPRPL